MQFTFPEEQQAFADSVRRFALAKLAPDALKRAHDPRYPFDVAQADERAGAPGHQPSRGGRRQGGTLMDAVIAIEQVAAVCPRSADVVQAGNFGPIRTLRRIRDAGAEGALPARPAGRAARLISLGMTEPDAGSAVTDLRPARPRRRRLRHQRHKVFSTHSPDADVFLVYVRYGPGRRRHRLGDRRARRARLQDRPAVALHERRGVVAALLRQLPHPGRERAARTGRLQEADRRLQRRAARQRRALARARPACLQRRARACADRGSSSAGRCASSRACSGSSPRWR